MFIPIEKILEDRISDKQEIIFNSTFEGVETDEMGDCDIIAISHAGRQLIKALPAYYVDDSKKEIIINDPRRNLRENAANKITLTVFSDMDHPFHIHEIDGYKFTMITINIPEDRYFTGMKYWRRDNWL